MKAVFILPNLSAGGAERVVTLLSRMLVKRGITVDILQFLSDKVQYDIPAGVQVISMNTQRLPLMKRVETLRTYFREQCRQSPEVIAMPFHDSCLKYALLASVGLRVRVIACERNDPYQKGCSGWPRFMANLLYAMADHCVFQTQDARDYYRMGVARKSTIIANPLIMSDEIEWRGQYSKTIVTVGRLEPQKNHKLLIEAFSRVHQLHPEYVLEIYGEGSLRQELQKQIDDLGLETAVFLRGYVSDVHQRLQDAAMFVLPSDYEGMSNALIEALAVGVPTISTDHPIGGAKALIKDAWNGLLTPVGDGNAFAEAMIRLLAAPMEAQRLGKNARGVRQMLDPDVIAEQWLTVMQKLGDK